MNRIAKAAVAAAFAGISAGACASASTRLDLSFVATSLDPAQQDAPIFEPAFTTSTATWSDAPGGPGGSGAVDGFLARDLDLPQGYDPNGWGYMHMGDSAIVANAYTNSDTSFSISGDSYGQFALSAFTSISFTATSSFFASNPGSGGSTRACLDASCVTFRSSDGVTPEVVSFSFANDSDATIFLNVDVYADAFSSGVPEPGNAALLLPALALLAAARRRRPALRAR